jgi:hypothetical protein
VAALLLDQAGSFFCGVVSDRFHGLFHCHAGGAQYLATTGDVSFWWKSLEKVLREGKANPYSSHVEILLFQDGKGPM